MHIDDDARARVAENSVVLKFRQHFTNGPLRTVRAHCIEHLLDVRRIIGQLRHETACLDACGFGAARDQRKMRLHEHLITPGAGSRDLSDDNFFESPANDLLHCCSSLV